MRHFFHSLAVVSCLTALGACSDDSGNHDAPPDDSMDAGGDDGTLDGGNKPDASIKKDGSVDGGKADAGLGDGGHVTDAAVGMDAAVDHEDSGVTTTEDAATPDAGKLDASAADAAADAAITDAGSDASADAGDAGHDAGVCNMATPHACYTPDAMNDPTCPATTPGVNTACTGPTGFASGCTYNGPGQTGGFCSCIATRFSCLYY